MEKHHLLELAPALRRIGECQQGGIVDRLRDRLPDPPHVRRHEAALDGSGSTASMTAYFLAATAGSSLRISTSGLVARDVAVARINSVSKLNRTGARNPRQAVHCAGGERRPPSVPRKQSSLSAKERSSSSAMPALRSWALTAPERS